MDGWMDGWIDGWMDGWIDGWIDGWMEDKSLTAVTDSKLFAIQEQEVAVKATRQEIWK